MIFRARQFEFIFPRPALVMGVVNVTPDSFSDGGKFFDPAKAVAHALELVAQGAEILDIGGESTRPGAKPVSEKEELRRVIPVVEKLAAKIKIPLSIDTMKPAVARAALQAGASIVNDVAANSRGRACKSADDIQKSIGVFTNAATRNEMLEIVSEFRAGYVCMHAPPTLHKSQKQKNIVHEVGTFFQKRLKKLKVAGISSEQIVFDPGIGFGKTSEQNLQLLANLRSFTTLARPLLIGVSRKSFIEKMLGAKVNERLPASLACASLAVADGVQIIRAHDVTETVQAVRMTEMLLAGRKNNVVLHPK
ncbi:MAG TPA: dihydropteroate synthase [Verrucomicrobiae bacterium]|jgi:dihydropteroate synthase